MKKLILVLLALCMAATAFATVGTNPGRNEYTATAAQTIFNYTFKIYASTDLLVYQTPTGQDPDDTADLITGYTVAGVGVDAGGSITLNSGATSGDLITIVSAIPTNRTVDYQFNGDFLPDVVNNDFDRAVSMVKQLENTSVNTLKYQNSFQGGAGTLADPAAGNVIGYDGSGNLANLLLAVDGNSWDGLTDLGDNTPGKGSDLVAHTSTAFTVTETLDDHESRVTVNEAAIVTNTADIAALKVLTTIVDLKQGATLSNNGADAVNDFDVTAGKWADSTLKNVLSLDTSFTKQMDTNWEEGTNGGALDTGTYSVDTWYSVWLIGTATGATVDILASEAMAAPTSMPSGYTLKRRVAVIYAYDDTATPTLRQFFQYGGDFQWDIPVLDVASVVFSTTQVISALSVPPVEVEVNAVLYTTIAVGVSNANVFGLVLDPRQTDTTPSSSIYNVTAKRIVAGTDNAGQEYTRPITPTTNDSTIGARWTANFTGSYSVLTTGWTDERRVTP